MIVLIIGYGLCLLLGILFVAAGTFKPMPRQEDEDEDPERVI